MLGIEPQLSSLQSAELGVLTTTPNARVTRRWNISTLPLICHTIARNWTNNPFYRQCHSLALASRLVRSGHGTTPGLQGYTATSLQPERSEGQIPAHVRHVGIFVKGIGRAGNRTAALLITKRRTRCVNHYTKRPCDQEVEYSTQRCIHVEY